MLQVLKILKNCELTILQEGQKIQASAKGPVGVIAIVIIIALLAFRH